MPEAAPAVSSEATGVDGAVRRAPGVRVGDAVEEDVLSQEPWPEGEGDVRTGDAEPDVGEATHCGAAGEAEAGTVDAVRPGRTGGAPPEFGAGEVHPTESVSVQSAGVLVRPAWDPALTAGREYPG